MVPLADRMLSWSNHSHGQSNSSLWAEVSGWFHTTNGTITFDVDEFNEDLSAQADSLEENLHPASDVDINGVLSSTLFNAVVFFAMVIAYEILRRCFPYVYANRQLREEKYSRYKQEHQGSEDDGNGNGNGNGIGNGGNGAGVGRPVRSPRRMSELSATKNLPDLYTNKSPLQWVGPVFGVSWRQVRAAAGLDAYFYLRYIRMCFRITSVSAFWGMLILFPIFYNGKNGAQGWYHFSMANVSQGNAVGIWVPTVFMYLFSAFVFFVMKQEYKHYVELRLDYLGKGDDSSDPQHHYSVIVENIPKELRSDRALFEYFDKMFPRRVHSANVILNCKDLEKMSAKKLTVTSRLEKSIAHYEATGKRPMHINGRPRITLFGIELGRLECLWRFNGLCCHEPNTFYDFDYDDDDLSKGDRVDSINYYTHELTKINKMMFVKQKQKRDVAEYGNESIRANSWFSKVSEFAQFFMDDPNVDESDDTDDGESSHGHSAIWGDSERFTTIVDDHDGCTDRTSGLSSPGGSSFQNEGNGLSPTNGDKLLGTFSPPSEVKISSPKGDKGDNDYQIEELSPRSHYGSLEKQTPSPTKKRPLWRLRRKKTVSFRRRPKENDEGSGSGSSKEEPLIGQEQGKEHLPSSAESPSTAIPILRNRGSSRPMTLPPPPTPCIGDEKTARKLSKLVGRLGLDFGAYSMKTLHRIFARTIEDEESKAMSKTGFVTFMDLGSVTCVASAPLTHKPNALRVNVAPPREDVLWQNCHHNPDLCSRRTSITNALLGIGALLWSIPLAVIQGVSSAENVAQLPGMEWILEYDNGNLAIFINAYLPVIGFLGLIMLLPIFFEWVAKSYEKRKTKSDVERSVVSRYFYYQLANIYISVTAGSLWKSAADIIARPSYGLEILGNSLPTVVGYFISLIITKILGGLPLVILRLGALFRHLFLRLITRTKFLTQRELDQVYREEPLLYGWEYPTQLLVIVICFTYACISPFILIFGAMYFLGALMVYKKQVLYVYTPEYESGGALFPMVCERTIIGLIAGQLTFIGYCIIRGGHSQPMALLPLVYFSFWTMNYFSVHFAEPSDRLTLERAKDLDELVRTYAQNISSPRLLLIPQARFSKDHYKQPILTERHGTPFFYRLEKEDELTKEARRRLSTGGGRTDMWMGSKTTTLNPEMNIIV